MDYKATITVTHKEWSGWEGGHYKTTSQQVLGSRGEAITPECVGHKKSDYEGWDVLFYEVLIVKVTEFQVEFAFRKLAIDNPGGGINLTARPSGRFSLRRGESQKLSTPTMDGGTGVTITVDQNS